MTDTVPGAKDSETRDAQRIAILLGTLFGLAAMGSAGAALALAPMAESYGISAGTAAWSISLYALFLGVGTAVYGRIADVAGLRLPMLLGLTLMTTGACLAALAPNFEVHLVGRIFQGAGSAAVPTIGAAVLSARYEGSVKAGALIRLASTAAAVTSLGPLLGGILVDTVSWRLAIALPLLGVAVLPALWPVLTVGGTGSRLDYFGAVLTALAAAGFVLLIQSPSTGQRVALAGFALVILGVPAVVGWVRRRPDGFLPISVVRNRTVLRSAFAASAIPASWFALLVALPAILLAAGYAPWQVGLALVPSGLVSLVMPKVLGPVLDQMTAAGALMLGAGVAAVALAIAAVSSLLDANWLLILAVVAVALSFGIGQPALSWAVGAAVDEEVRGVALGVATLVFMVGGSVGSAVIGGLSPVIGVTAALTLLIALPLGGMALVWPNVQAARAARLNETA